MKSIENKGHAATGALKNAVAGKVAMPGIMKIKKATYKDLSKILNLQKLAYLSEAKLVNDYSIQPLTQTPEELEKEFSKGIILKIENENMNEIIGSVRAYEENDCVYTGKLMVHPEYQNRGIGTNLLKTIETYYKNKTFELFTSNRSEKNILFYAASVFSFSGVSSGCRRSCISLSKIPQRPCGYCFWFEKLFCPNTSKMSLTSIVEAFFL